MLQQKQAEREQTEAIKRQRQEDSRQWLEQYADNGAAARRGSRYVMPDTTNNSALRLIPTNRMYGDEILQKSESLYKLLQEVEEEPEKDKRLKLVEDASRRLKPSTEPLNLWFNNLAYFLQDEDDPRLASKSAREWLDGNNATLMKKA